MNIGLYIARYAVATASYLCDEINDAQNRPIHLHDELSVHAEMECRIVL